MGAKLHMCVSMYVCVKHTPLTHLNRSCRRDPAASVSAAHATISRNKDAKLSKSAGDVMKMLD